MSKFEQLPAEEPKKSSAIEGAAQKAMLGLALMAGACGLKPEEVAQMPTTEVPELIAHPEKFEKDSEVKVVAFLKFEKTEVKNDTSLAYSFSEKKTVTEYLKIRVDSYELHGKQTLEDPAFQVHMTDSKSTTSLVVHLLQSAPELPRCVDGQAYRLVGTVKSDKGKDGKIEYYLELNPTAQERLQKIEGGAEK